MSLSLKDALAGWGEPSERCAVLMHALSARDLALLEIIQTCENYQNADTEGMELERQCDDGYRAVCKVITVASGALAELEAQSAIAATLTTCKYWIVTDGKEAAPLAMFRNKFDATQWQYLQCPTGNVEAFDMAVKT